MSATGYFTSRPTAVKITYIKLFESSVNITTGITFMHITFYHFHNILRLFVLSKFVFTKSETMRDYYL